MKIVLILLLVLIVLYILTHSCSKSAVSRFFYTDPKHAYKSIVKELGHPDIIVNRPGGFAMWFPENSPLKSIILKDERVPHGNHSDFLYVTVDIDISDDDLQKVVSTNKSTFYDADSGELIVRCNSLASCRATIFAIVQRLINPDVWNSILSRDVEQQTLSKMINNTDLSTSLDGCLSKHLDIAKEGFYHTKKYHYMEGFFPKEYKQIPVAP